MIGDRFAVVVDEPRWFSAPPPASPGSTNYRPRSTKRENDSQFREPGSWPRERSGGDSFRRRSVLGRQTSSAQHFQQLLLLFPGDSNRGLQFLFEFRPQVGILYRSEEGVHAIAVSGGYGLLEY